jgi:hypothetical protein
LRTGLKIRCCNWSNRQYADYAALETAAGNARRAICQNSEKIQNVLVVRTYESAPITWKPYRIGACRGLWWLDERTKTALAYSIFTCFHA